VHHKRHTYVAISVPPPRLIRRLHLVHTFAHIILLAPSGAGASNYQCDATRGYVATSTFRSGDGLVMSLHISSISHVHSTLASDTPGKTVSMARPFSSELLQRLRAVCSKSGSEHLGSFTVASQPLPNIILCHF